MVEASFAGEKHVDLRKFVGSKVPKILFPKSVIGFLNFQTLQGACVIDFLFELELKEGMQRAHIGFLE